MGCERDDAPFGVAVVRQGMCTPRASDAVVLGPDRDVSGTGAMSPLSSPHRSWIGNRGSRRLRRCCGFLRRRCGEAKRRVCTLCTPWASDWVIYRPDWAGFPMFPGEPSITVCKGRATLRPVLSGCHGHQGGSVGLTCRMNLPAFNTKALELDRESSGVALTAKIGTCPTPSYRKIGSFL